MSELVETPSKRPKDLAIELGELQREAKGLGLPSIVVIEGIDGSGKGHVLNRVLLELDARVYSIRAVHASERHLQEHPLLWDMWNNLPLEGDVQFFDRSAYYRVLDAWAEGGLPEKTLDQYWKDIVSFERNQVDAGTLLIKVFLVSSKKEQARRFKALENNPKTAWRVRKKDWRRHEQYAAYRAQVESMMQSTKHPGAEWSVIETDDLKKGTQRLYEILIESFRAAIEKRKASEEKQSVRDKWIPYTGRDYLSEIDLTSDLDRSEYKQMLKERQSEMYELVHQINAQKIPVVLVYCGSDAAGKGGCIKRLLQGIDPRSFKVIGVGPPSERELAHHYLWRFWKQLPPRGRITIFDRSWYGRVLVERVEDFCTNKEWQQAYQEINEMEAQLTNFGTVILKFWLHIDQDTQLERFRAREENPIKQWKITPDDWRNREKSHLYDQAVNEMVENTNTKNAPWNLVSSVSKMHARIRTLDITIAALKAAIKRGRIAPM
tara:strand:+ start:52597 stop:54072 length:1476 start_codon:yes stop_codon:yes gene_type:complete